MSGFRVVQVSQLPKRAESRRVVVRTIRSAGSRTPSLASRKCHSGSWARTSGLQGRGHIRIPHVINTGAVRDGECDRLCRTSAPSGSEYRLFQAGTGSTYRQETVDCRTHDGPTTAACRTVLKGPALRGYITSVVIDVVIDFGEPLNIVMRTRCGIDLASCLEPWSRFGQP